MVWRLLDVVAEVAEHRPKLSDRESAGRHDFFAGLAIGKSGSPVTSA